MRSAILLVLLSLLVAVCHATSTTTFVTLFPDGNTSMSKVLTIKDGKCYDVDAYYSKTMTWIGTRGNSVTLYSKKGCTS
ncbi:hypothetical protein GGI04_006239, partial [Coemansia thaxteri]